MDIGRKNKESFWPSYVDIMTTLFAVMLILFAVSYARFKLKESQLEILVKEYKDIIDVYSTVDEIDKSDYYAYDSLYLKHTITISMAEAAGFIGAVASLFAAAGLTKAGSEWSENKYIYNTSHKNTQTCEGDDEEVPIPNEGVVEE